MGGSSWGATLFGFAAGSAVTAAAAYLLVARDMERLQQENKRLHKDELVVSTRSSISSARAIAASGEHVGFLTDILKQLWGYIRVAGADSIKETVEPMFKDMMPGPLKSLKFTKIDLGSIPIRMDNVVVHKVDEKNKTLQFDLDVVWDGNCDIQLKAGSLIGFGCKSVKLRGRMCIAMCPLTTDLSIVEGIQYSFINPPDLELDFTGLAQVADVRGVDAMMRNILQDIMASMIVLPERMLYKNVAACSFLDIYRKPLGIACVTVESGRGFVVEQKTFGKNDVPDCYCNLKLGSRSTRTSTIKDNLSPVWNESHEFLLCDMDQIISLEAMDEDKGALDADDYLGETTATFSEILLNGGRQEFALVDKKNHRPNGARVTLGCKVVNFTSDLTSLKETKEKDCFAGVLVILVVGAFDIPLKKEKAATFVKVEYDDKTFVTGAVVAAPGVDALNPAYDLAFHVPLTPSMVKNGKMKDITFSLMNGEKTSLGSFKVTHDQVAAAPDNVLTEKRPIGSGGAKVEFRVMLDGVDRKAKVQSRTLTGPGVVTGDDSGSNTRSAATSDDYVSVEPGAGPPTAAHTKVRVTAVSGKGFKIEKRSKLRKKDIPDIYCIVKVGTTASAWRTKTIKNNTAPVWNESKVYPFVNHGQIVNIEVWDENSGRFTKDDYRGSSRVTVGEFLLKGGSMEVELLSEGNPTGLYVTFKCELID